MLVLVWQFLFFFFFQAEDGIRDLTVTGVQTCALPISGPRGAAPVRGVPPGAPGLSAADGGGVGVRLPRRHHDRLRLRQRSEERRVGKECRSRWSPYE